MKLGLGSPPALVASLFDVERRRIEWLIFVVRPWPAPPANTNKDGGARGE